MLSRLLEAPIADLHCHPDGLGDLPDDIAVLAVTSSPDEYRATTRRFAASPRVVIALGLHPLMPASHYGATRRRFAALAIQAVALGEVGLDFSAHARIPAEVQLATLRVVLDSAGDRLVSFHSRRGERQLMDEVERANRGSRSVLHWFGGGPRLAARAAQLGMYFSINPSMLGSARGRQLIASAPPDRILLESDAPFAKVRGRPSRPHDVREVVAAIADEWGCSRLDAAERVRANLRAALTGLPVQQLEAGL